MTQLPGRVPVSLRRHRRALIGGAIVVIGLCCIAILVVLRGSRPSTPFRILASPENQALEPILRQYGNKSSQALDIHYLDSVSLVRQLTLGTSDFDAVWPASSIWIAVGDRRRVVSNQRSIWRSPVILGVKLSTARQLDWVDRDVSLGDVLRASEAGNLRLLMPSASQSNAGAFTYLGMLYDYAGKPDVLTSATLQDPDLYAKVLRLGGTIGQTNYSSMEAKKLLLENYAGVQGIFADEATIIELNQQLVKTGREPLQAVYPAGATVIADYPLGYVDQGDKGKEKFFRELQAHLLAEGTQSQIAKLGRRTSLVGIDPTNVDRSVFNPQWGIDVDRILTAFRFPSAEVIYEALKLYQNPTRRGSITVYALDVSMSMTRYGKPQIDRAMLQLLDQQIAAQALLEASPQDVTIVMPFNQGVIDEWVVIGNDPGAIAELSDKIQRVRPSGGTDLLAPLRRARHLIETYRAEGRTASIVLFSDGHSTQGNVDEVLAMGGDQIPVYAIATGIGSVHPRDELVRLASGPVFDGRSLAEVVRKAKGYN